MNKARRERMTLAQLLLLGLIVVVIWMGCRVKTHEERIAELESKAPKKRPGTTTRDSTAEIGENGE